MESVTTFGREIPIWSVVPILCCAAVGVVAFFKGTSFLTRTAKDDDGKPVVAKQFGGPIGAMCMPIFLPAICYFLNFGVNKDYVISLNPLNPLFFQFDHNPFANGISGFIDEVWNTNVFLVYSTWVIGHWILYLIVPGPVIPGTELKNHTKTRLLYRMNALRCHVISVAILIGLIYADILPVTYAYDNSLQLVSAAFVFSLTLSILLYAHSILTIPRVNSSYNSDPLNMLSYTGNSGNFFYDFWMGRTLNPRIGFLDLKCVNELRPGLTLWSVMNFSMAAKQYQNLGHITGSMALVCLFHFFYVVDAHWFEPAILSTMDITTDGFGFMLAFGDLCWVPMNYTLQTRYLVDHDPNLSYWAIFAIFLLKIVGLLIFRLSNLQKNNFRSNPNDPSVAHLKYLDTKRGTKLIISGWWGISRHMNYFGDLIMGLAWCLPCGFDYLLPYFYVIYFAALLIDRQERDDQECQVKYGDDWNTYCEMVPYKIIPYVY